MSNKIDRALERLNGILPLKQSQEACEPKIKYLHQQILQFFVTKGRVPSHQEMALHTSDIASAIELLSDNDMVTVSASGELTGAYPFSVEKREHIVRVNGHVLYAMCALDTLAVAPMFHVEAGISSKCVLTGEPLMIKMQNNNVSNLNEVSQVHFGITWSATDAGSCCADSLCREMVFLRDHQTAQQWLAQDSADREVFALEEAVEFADRFFSPLLL